VGTDGNAFAILGVVTRALRRVGNPPEVIDAYKAQATAGDYDHLLAVSMVYAGMMPAPDDDRAPGHNWRYGVNQCDLCGEGLGGNCPHEASAEVVDTQTGDRLIVHAEPCSYEHGDRYEVA
jgi:hypothetical protein